MPMDPEDIDAFFDRDSLAIYEEAIRDELARSFEIGALREGLTKSQAQVKAEEYAKTRGSALITGIDETTRSRIRELVGDAISNGDSLQTLRKAIDEDGIFGKDRAYTIARTETAFAHGRGAHDAAQLEGQDQKSWVRNQEDPDDECQDNEDIGWIDIDEDFPSGDDTIPAHPNCFIEGTPVIAKGVLASSERFYEGPVIIIRTARGHQITVTPNHPILTRQGWIAAGALDEGDDLFSCEIEVGSVRPDDYPVPTLIEEVAKSVGVSERTYTVPVSAEDFHGDGVQSQVAIVRSNRLLRNGVETLLLKQITEPHLVFGHSQASKLTSRSPGLLSDDRINGSTSSDPRRFQVGDGRPSGFPRLLSGGRVAPRDHSIGAQELGDPSTIRTVPNREALSTLTGDVRLDQIIEIRWKPWAGHVYSLQTLSGFYAADYTLVSNCECDVIYRTADLYSEDDVQDDEDSNDPEGAITEDDNTDQPISGADFVKIFNHVLTQYNYSDDQERDDHGRFAGGGGSEGATEYTSVGGNIDHSPESDKVGTAMFHSNPGLFSSEAEAQHASARLTSEWEQSATSPGSIGLQHAAMALAADQGFGKEGFSTSWSAADDKAGWQTSDREDKIQNAWVHSQYESTQAALGGQEQTLYRGVSWDREPASIKSLGLAPGQSVDTSVRLNPLSSFSGDKGVAHAWAAEYESKRQYALTAKVPADRVFMKLSGDAEMVVLGGMMPTNIERLR